ncbi:hypothetical protein KCP77_04400 [Salmonella enterica subsp. enterica]|nr:hypothetical protein KCP77_04400 [Salmonella enterica subsp. enterica]
MNVAQQRPGGGGQDARRRRGHPWQGVGGRFLSLYGKKLSDNDADAFYIWFMPTSYFKSLMCWHGLLGPFMGLALPGRRATFKSAPRLSCRSPVT